MRNRRILPLIIYLVILGVAFSWITGMFSGSGNTIPYSQVVDLFEHEQVRSFLVQGDTLTMNLHTPYNGETTISTALSDPDTFRLEMQEILRSQKASGVLESYDFVSIDESSPFDQVINFHKTSLEYIYYI